MKTLRNVLFAALPAFCVAAALVAARGHLTQEAIPKTFDSAVSDREAPLWVAADLARTPENEIDLALFAPSERESLRRQLAAQERLRAVERPKDLSPLQKAGREPVSDANCVTYEKTFFHLSGERKAPGLEGLVESARGIYSATISDVSQGFFLGSPASVLRLDLTETWKTDGTVPPGGELFAVYPFARFAIGKGVFCSGMPESAVQPEAGQRVIVFVTSDPLDKERSLVWTDPEALIVEKAEGGVSMPRALKEDPELFPVQSFEEAVELLRRMLHRPNHQKPSMDRRESGR